MNSIDFAIRKINALIETIELVKEMDFPYSDPKKAVIYIGKHFIELKNDLEGVENSNVARTLCKQVIHEIDQYLLALGFMVRACDVRGPLELQRPLLRLTHLAIGTEVKLVISSEWGFSPFTLLYPGQFGDQFVLVGLPASEAGNPLIAPLSGHELGHNIWRRAVDLQETVGDQIKSSIVEIIRDEMWAQFSSSFGITSKDQLDQEDLFKDTSWQIAFAWAISQCEEMFCDFVGVFTFGESYLHAFRYLLSPGGGPRNPVYPSDRNRVESIAKAAASLGIEVAEFASEFLDSDGNFDPRQQLLLSLSDKATLRLMDDLIEKAKTFCQEKGISGHDPSGTDSVLKHLQRATPATGAKSLANILNAAWRIYLDPVNPWGKDYPVTNHDPDKRILLLRELTLKSFEVFEIEQIQGS